MDKKNVLKQIDISANKIYQNFPEVAVSNLSIKKAMTFRREACLWSSSSKKWAKMNFLSKFM